LNVIEIRVPPLRERKKEIPVLVSAILAELNEQYGRNVQVSPAHVAILTDYPWPGNVRELENFLRRLVVLESARPVEETLADLRRDPVSRASQAPGDSAGPAADRMPMVGLSEIARKAAREAERQALLEVLDRVRWNRTAAARILKVSYKTLLNKIAECGL